MKFLVYSPQFDDSSGGAIALHRLCHLLRGLGVEALLWPAGKPSPLRRRGANYWFRARYYDLLRYKNGPYETNESFLTPIATPADLTDAIAIYPETIDGNPLGVRRSVRWLLHFPGFLAGASELPSDELTFCYQDEFASAEVRSSGYFRGRLQTLWVRDDLYFEASTGERSGECYMVRKGRVEEPLHGQSALCLDGLTHAEIAREFQRRSIFYSYDPYTMYSAYAAACGCDSVVVPPPGMTQEEWYEDETKCFGLAYGEDKLEWARSTRSRALEFMKGEELRATDSVRRFIDACRDHFGDD